MQERVNRDVQGSLLTNIKVFAVAGLNPGCVREKGKRGNRGRSKKLFLTCMEKRARPTGKRDKTKKGGGRREERKKVRRTRQQKEKAKTGRQPSLQQNQRKKEPPSGISLTRSLGT